jgi:hypothetical protein
MLIQTKTIRQHFTPFAPLHQPASHTPEFTLKAIITPIPANSNIRSNRRRDFKLTVRLKSG